MEIIWSKFMEEHGIQFKNTIIDQGTGDLNELGFMKHLSTRYYDFLGYSIWDTKGMRGDTDYKVDIVVSKGQEPVALYQVKSSRKEAQVAWYEKCLSTLAHTYDGIKYPVHVVYPDDDGKWVEFKG